MVGLGLVRIGPVPVCDAAARYGGVGDRADVVIPAGEHLACVEREPVRPSLRPPNIRDLR